LRLKRNSKKFDEKNHKLQINDTTYIFLVYTLKSIIKNRIYDHEFDILSAMLDVGVSFSSCYHYRYRDLIQL